MENTNDNTHEMRNKKISDSMPKHKSFDHKRHISQGLKNYYNQRQPVPDKNSQSSTIRDIMLE